MNQKTVQFDIGNDFSAFPGGRFISDGPASGEEFREQYLVPLIQANDKVIITLDNAMGYGSSFLEEAFGGLVRHKVIDKDALLGKLELVSDQESIKNSIIQYISDAQ